MSARECARPAVLPRLLPGSVAALTLVAVLTAIGGTAGADEGFSARGFYAGLGVGASRLEPESPIDGLRIDDGRDTGFHLSLGYDFSRWLSLELQLADLGAAGIDRVTGTDAAGEETLETDFDAIEYRIADVAALLYLFDTHGGFVPGRDDAGFRRGGLSLYARLGLGAMFNDAERDRVRHERVESAHLATGLGLEYGFADGLAARAEYVAYDTDAQYASLGVLWRFGRSPAPVPPPPGPKAALPVPTPSPKVPPPPPPPPFDPANADGRFAFDSAVLTPESRETLDRFAASVAGRDGELLIEGHTDSVGPADYNEGLGLRRARAARDYLIGLGIAAERVRVESFGERRPVADNETGEGRARNRRIEAREL